MENNEVLRLIRRRVRDLSAYHLDKVDCAVKLNQNENPYDWPAEIKEEVAAHVRDRPWNRYPAFVPGNLKHAIAGYCGARADSVIVGNGSNEMLLVLLLSFMEKDAVVITCQPTFTVYNLLVNGLGGSPQSVMLDRDLRYDSDAVCTACRASPGAILIIASPNNPTGSSLSEQEIRAILEAHTGIFVLDQAYVEFGGFDAMPLIEEYPNLIITRTFSKALSGAGLRIGYMAGNSRIIAEINKIKLPYNINFFSEQAAAVLLRNKVLIGRRVALLVKERNRLSAYFVSLPGINIYKSDTNFILLRTEQKNALFAYLKSRGILVRDVSSYPMLRNCLRINVGTPEENRALMNACENFFAAK
ncbi:MAG: histidinol-phosphate transaminase [Chitinivibrionales bacterium]|nr:histidinol-phosphate transaminase [Chitinivibrionales bacterium]